MEKQTLTFEQLPHAVHELSCRVDNLTRLLATATGQSALPAPDSWLSIEQLSDYLPGKPAINTLYGKAQRGEIPYRRMGKRLVFLKSEVDQWLNDKFNVPKRKRSGQAHNCITNA